MAWMIQGSILGRYIGFFSSQKCPDLLGTPPCFLFSWYLDLFHDSKVARAWDLTLTCSWSWGLDKWRNTSTVPLFLYVMYRADLSLMCAISLLIMVTWTWMIPDLYSEKIASDYLKCGMACIFVNSHKCYKLCLSLSIALWACMGEGELKLCAYLLSAVEEVVGHHHTSAAVWLPLYTRCVGDNVSNRTYLSMVAKIGIMSVLRTVPLSPSQYTLT
jgi:hypothetical protein